MKRRTWFDWHSWIGLTTGLLLFVVCWSGTVAVFARELDWLVQPARRAATGPDEAIPWGRIEANVQAARPGWRVDQINAPHAPGFAVEAWVRAPDDIMGRVYADPVTGQVLGASSYFNLQRFFRSLHMSLFIADWDILGIPFGYLLVALLSIPLLLQLVTGLIFYSRFWRGFFRLERGKGKKVFWSDLHKLSGVWAIWFVALIGLTGVWYLAEWKVPPWPPLPEPPRAQAASRPLEELLPLARAAYPELLIREVSLYDRDRGLVAFHGQDGSLLLRDRAARVWMDARTGQVLGVLRPSEMSPLHRWIDTADPLHFGAFASVWSKAVWFVFGLALSAMCLTGAYLQAQRQARGRGLKRRTLHAAHLATVVVLLCAAGFAVDEIRGYGAGVTPFAPAGVWWIAALFTASVVGALGWWMAAVSRLRRPAASARLHPQPTMVE
jgi:uncharacterized iron-regulated membrane protein